MLSGKLQSVQAFLNESLGKNLRHGLLLCHTKSLLEKFYHSMVLTRSRIGRVECFSLDAYVLKALRDGFLLSYIQSLHHIQQLRPVGF